MLPVLAASACDAEAPSANGADAFGRSCASCHAVERWQGAEADRLGTPESRADLDAFLSRHHAPNAAERAAIIDYLAAQGR